MIVNLCAALTNGKSAHAQTRTEGIFRQLQPMFVSTEHIINHCGFCIFSPVEHTHFQMGDAHTPHSVEPGGANRMQVGVTAAHFIHVHAMHITLHPHWQMYLGLVWIGFRVCVNESVQPTVWSRQKYWSDHCASLKTRIKNTWICKVMITTKPLPFHRVTLVEKRRFNKGNSWVCVYAWDTATHCCRRCFCMSTLDARVEKVSGTAQQRVKSFPANRENATT